MPFTNVTPRPKSVVICLAISSGLDVTTRNPFPAKPPFTDDINDDGVNQDKEEGVGCNSEVLKDDQNSCQDDGIHNQHEASHGKRRVLVKDTCDNIGSTCVPPALKIIPSPVPRITPDPIQARRISPSRAVKTAF